MEATAQQFQANWRPGNGRPDNLIVCGDSDEGVYRVSLGTSQPQARNIQVTVQLFEGIRFAGFNAANSSPGVSVIDASDPTRPVIGLPNLVPTASGRSADFALILEARCDILDTLNNHDDMGGSNPIQVFDRLSIRYTDISSNTRTELKNIDPYAAAIAAPIFSIVDNVPGAPFRAGDQVTRIDTISNGSVRGYADTVVYQVTQGRDASLQAIRVNGVAKAFAKTPNAAGDTIITITLAGADFAGNLVGGAVGNSNTRFDPNESLVIEEDLVILSCGPNRLAQHRVLFGCDQQVCWDVPNISELMIGSGQPELEILRGSPFPDTDVGYCKPGELTVYVRNVGRETDPTFGEARNIAVSAVFSEFGASLAAGGYVITQLDVAGVPIPNVAFSQRLDTLSGFQTDPDGPRGLQDLDGDGYFDDLAVLDSFALKIYYELDCAILDDDELDENCANDAFTTMQVFAYFNNACGTLLNGRDINLYSPQNVQDDFEEFTQPDAFAEGDPFQIELEFGRLVFRFDESSCTSPEMRVYVDLPAGVTVDAGSSALSRGGGAGMPLLSLTQTGQVATMTFDPSGESHLTGVYNLVVGMSADCSAPLGETNFNTRVGYYCADCDCEHTWICEDIVGPWIHKTAPPCPLASLYPCPQGVQGTSFSINRTTIGFSTPSFTTPIAAANVNRKVAIPADSVEIVIDGTVGDNVVTDSLGIILHYFTPNEQLDTAGLFLLGGGVLEWKDGATWRSCPIAPTAHTIENDTTETWQRFDLSQCLISNGWSIRPGDSIKFVGHFEINPLGPILDSYEFVEDLRGGFYATDGGTETQCDQFGETFRVGKPFTTFAVPSNGEFPKGCDPAMLDFRLSSVNRGYVEEFGQEFRRAARLDSIVLDFDTTILSAFDDVQIELQVAGHPTQGNTFYSVPPLSDFPDGRYVLQLDTLDYSAELVTNYPFLYNLRVHLTPNCSSIRGSDNNDEFYPIQATPHYRDRYYAIDIGNGSRVLTVTDEYPFVMSYSQPASLDLTVTSPVFQRITTDSGFVELEICNTSPLSRAARTWLTFNDTTTLSIEEALNIDDPNNPISIPIEAYAGGHFINMEPLERVNGVNISTQVCNFIRLKVRTVGCGINGVSFTTGWDCEATVPVGWTPSAATDCIDDIGLARFEPIAPFLEADLIREPSAPVDLCAPVVMEFQVNNAQPGTAYDVLSRFYVPPGLEYIPGSVMVEYPADASADNFVSTVSDFVAVDTSIRGFGWELPDLDAISPYLGANGLMGFDASNPNDSNRFVLRVEFATNCDYRSGSLVFFETEGSEACGDRTNLAVAESAALQITGTQPDGSHAYAVGFEPAMRISIVQPVSTLEVFATNVGTDPTDADDVLQVTLPAGYTYEPASAVGTVPNGYLPGEPIVTQLGTVTQLEWPLPLNMLPNETARIQFDLRAASASCGDVADAGLAAIRYIDAACVTSGTDCRIATDVTQGGAVLHQLPIGEVFAARVLINEADCESATTEVVRLEVALDAGGFTLTGNGLQVALYHDVNGDQQTGPGDVLLDQQSLTTTAGDAGVVYSFGGSLNRNVLNGLLLRIDSIGQPICAPQDIVLDLPRLDNAGAQDTYQLCVSDNPTLSLGDLNCAGATDLSFQWSAEPASMVTFLSDATSATPQLTLPNPYTGADTVRYILMTNRLGLGITRDTAVLIVGAGVVLAQGPTEIINNGDQVVLTPNILQGAAPFSYLWQPATGLSSATDAQPIASPQSDQLYQLTITDRFGCSDQTTHLVRVRNPINPNVTPLDTVICPDATLTLVASGGADIQWVAAATNPTPGGLSTTTGSPVVFSSQGATGEYNFEVTISDPAFPGYDSTLQVRIVVDAAAACSTACTLPTLLSEFTTSTPCGGATGSVALSYSGELSNFNTAWLHADGDTLAQNTSALGNLPAGVYQFVAVNVSDSGCAFERSSYVSSEEGPFAAVAKTPSDCGAANGTATLTPASLNYLWPDGVQTATRSDLAAGDYRVAVSDPAAPNCVRYQLIRIDAAPGLVVDFTINALPTCGSLDGSVTLTVAGGSGNYDYDWSVNTATNTNLAAGSYRVTVTDRDSGCTGSISFVLADDVPAAVVNILGGEGETCPASADGSIDFTVTYDAAFTGPADTLILSAGGDTVRNGNLSSGSYCIVIRDGNGCVAGGNCLELIEPEAILADITTSDACGVAGGALSIQMRSGREPISYSLSNGLTSDTSYFGDLSAGFYTLTVTDSAACSATYGISIGQCEPCNYTSAPADTVHYQTSCTGTAAVCIGGIANRADDIQIFTNGTRYLGGLVPCDYARTRITYLIGVINYTVPLEARVRVDGQQHVRVVASIAELTQFFVDIDPQGNWVYDAATQTLIGGQRDGRYSSLELQRQGSQLVNTIPYNERIEPFGLAIELSPGFFEVVVRDTVAGCSDTLYVGIHCAPTDTLVLNIPVTLTDTFCVSTSDLPGNLVSLNDICPDTTYASYTTLNDTCVTVTGNVIGSQTACMVACDDLGICDTTYVIINVLPNSAGFVWRDTIFVDEDGQLCLTAADLNLPPGDISISNTCPGASGAQVAFDLSSSADCVDYAGLAAGEETACLEVCDSAGNCVSGSLIVTVLPAAKLLVYREIFINQTDSLCLDTVANLVSTSIFRTAEDLVEASIDSLAPCVRFRGLTLGQDTLGYEAIRSDGSNLQVCIIIDVVPFDGEPAAQQDFTCTERNTPIRVNVLANDQVFGGVASFQIVEQPSVVDGSVRINSDNTITFEPAADVCARDVTMVYEVCNPNSCDTATVTICIECDELTIFTAVSPNGDGVNDVFYIAEIEEFPDNELRIYNRWGNLVHQERAYLNTWYGTYRGDPLPDGAYFYILTVRNEGRETSYNGYLELLR